MTTDQGVGERHLRLLLSLLKAKGVVTEEEIQEAVAAMDARTPALGARAVARAWVDAGFRNRLVRTPESAFAELGIPVEGPPLGVLENTERVHHLVVCTLCSCYPRAVLGLPPLWYKSREYRSRAVREPRAVLREFGLQLPEEVEVRVVDSSADLRYLVLPLRPPETEGMSEAELAALVTRDSLVGTGLPRTPLPRRVGPGLEGREKPGRRGRLRGRAPTPPRAPDPPGTGGSRAGRPGR